MIVSDQKFEIRKHNLINSIPVRFVSEPPKQRLITFFSYADFFHEGVEKKLNKYLIYTPWVHYQWEYRPDIVSKHPWLITSILFSPVSLAESLNASKPCLPNFYNCSPCCSGEIIRVQDDFTDPTFIHDYWSESFNCDGDMLADGDHPVWKALQKQSLRKERKLDHAEAIANFRAWERLNKQEVLELPWPQDIIVPLERPEQF